MSRTEFLNQLKSKMVKIDRETKLGVTIGVKLSRRAVMKEQGSDGCVSNREDSHQ